MVVLTPAVLGWRLYRTTGHFAQRRHRATLAAVVDDIKSTQQRSSSEQHSSSPQQPRTAAMREQQPKNYQELPCPHRYPLLGSLPGLVAAGGPAYYHKYITQMHRELGGVFRERQAGTDVVFVSDPGCMKQVFAAEGQYPRHFIPEAWLLYNSERRVNRGLFFMDGEEWKQNRRVLNRWLARPSSARVHQRALARVADDLVSRWTAAPHDRAVPQLERDLYRWAMESVGMVTLGRRLGCLSEDAPAAARHQMDDFIDAVHDIFTTTTAIGPIPPSLARALHLPVWKRFTQNFDRALSSGRQLVEEGLRATRQGGRHGGKAATLLDQLVHDEGLPDHTTVALLTDLFIAAADTTSHTAVWCLYLLGRHPEHAARARQEVLTSAAWQGQLEGDDLLADLPYLKGIVKEALRLYPVAPFQTRILAHDTEIAGHLVPAGMMVILSVYTTGRDPTLFPDPDKFCPERWMRASADITAYDKMDSLPATGISEVSSHQCSRNYSSSVDGCPASSHSSTATGRIHSHAFIPFSVGARSCVGRRVAETQLYLLLAKLLTQADLRALNQVEMVLRMIGVTSKPVQLQVTPLL